MLLLYNDDRRCILGQWYENTHVQQPNIQTISLQINGYLRFYFANKGNAQFYTHVKALEGPLNEIGATYVDIAYGVSNYCRLTQPSADILQSEMGWMFSGQCDIVFCCSE